MKKLTSLLLALALCLGLSVPALAAEFSDVPPGHAFRDAVADCAAKGIASGYADGTFRPANPVTRAQFCVMLARAFYPDLVERHSSDYYKEQGWFVPYSQALYNAYVLPGTSFPKTYNDASVMDQPISRYDMAQVMANIMLRKGFPAASAQKTEAQAKITDYNSIPAQYQDAVKSVFALGIITGFSDGSFGGDRVMNRGQGCVAVYRMTQYISADQPAAAPEPEPEAPVTPAQPETSTTGVLTNGKPITEDNVLAMLKELEAKYPEKTDFSAGYPSGGQSSIRQATGQYPFFKGATVSTRIECGGWAALVADYLYGQTYVTWRKTTVANIRPGDLLITLNNDGKSTHVSIAYSKSWHDDDCQSWFWNVTEAGYDSAGVNDINWNVLHSRYDDGYGYDTSAWTCYPE